LVDPDNTFQFAMDPDPVVQKLEAQSGIKSISLVLGAGTLFSFIVGRI
jgi:hypothetical protein